MTSPLSTPVQAVSRYKHEIFAATLLFYLAGYFLIGVAGLSFQVQPAAAQYGAGPGPGSGGGGGDDGGGDGGGGGGLIGTINKGLGKAFDKGTEVVENIAKTGGNMARDAFDAGGDTFQKAADWTGDQTEKLAKSFGMGNTGENLNRAITNGGKQVNKHATKTGRKIQEGSHAVAEGIDAIGDATDNGAGITNIDDGLADGANALANGGDRNKDDDVNDALDEDKQITQRNKRADAGDVIDDRVTEGGDYKGDNIGDDSDEDGAIGSGITDEVGSDPVDSEGDRPGDSGYDGPTDDTADTPQEKKKKKKQTCEEVSCGPGKVCEDGSCEKIECPEGTYLDGDQCVSCKGKSQLCAEFGDNACGSVSNECGDTFNCGECTAADVEGETATCKNNVCVTPCDADGDGYDKDIPRCGGKDCNDNNADAKPDQTWFKDQDGDGSCVAMKQCLQPSEEDPELWATSCADATEICSGSNPHPACTSG